jgi:DNA adenine methylase
VKSPLKWHGGKGRIAPSIVALFPPRCRTPGRPADSPGLGYDSGYLHYVEPYFGGGAVLLANDPAGISEVANDLYGDLMNFWRVVRGTATFDRFRRECEAIPLSESDWESAAAALAAPPDDSRHDVTRAWNFFVFCRQSLSARMDQFTVLSQTCTRCGMNEQAGDWLRAVDRLPEVHARLRRVAVLNRPAAAVISSEDGPRTLFYLDPPYLGESRVSPDVYRHEMTRAGHADLLDLVRTVRGRVLLSGYRTALYDDALRSWVRRDFHVPNHAGHGKEKRRVTECVWMNYEPPGPDEGAK